jgi:hypothetical protein
MLFFANRILTVKRFLPGTMDHGRCTPGKFNTFTIHAGVQEVTPEELQLLPEGKRTRKSAFIITETELRLATATTLPDWVEIDGEQYEVESKALCRSNVINHCEYIALKIENPQDYDTEEA